MAMVSPSQPSPAVIHRTSISAIAGADRVLVATGPPAHRAFQEKRRREYLATGGGLRQAKRRGGWRESDGTRSGWCSIARRIPIFDDGAHPVISLAVDFDPVHLALKAGEPFSKLLHGEDELDNGGFGGAKALAGHRHGNARGVGNQHECCDSAGHLLEAEALGLVADEFLVSLGGREYGIEVFVAGGIDQASEVEFDHGCMHLVGELAERDVAIAVGKTLDEFRESF